MFYDIRLGHSHSCDQCLTGLKVGAQSRHMVAQSRLDREKKFLFVPRAWLVNAKRGKMKMNYKPNSERISLGGCGCDILFRLGMSERPERHT